MMEHRAGRIPDDVFLRLIGSKRLEPPKGAPSEPGFFWARRTIYDPWEVVEVYFSGELFVERMGRESRFPIELAEFNVWGGKIDRPS
jgi:hypothetical protein